MGAMPDPHATAPPPPLPATASAESAVHVGPVAAWLALQMVALLLAGFRVPLSARFPSPEEHVALHEMLVVQTIASALLFPVLFPTFATGVLVVATTPVMILLAA